MTAAPGSSGAPLASVAAATPEKPRRRVWVPSAIIVLAMLGPVLPAQAADPAALLGCWRDYDENVSEVATQVVLLSGDIGLSWGIDPATGGEMVGMLPYGELCFEADGTVRSTAILIDEGLGSSGQYQFNGRRLSVHDDHDFADGWPFSGRDAVCTVRIDAGGLTLGGCSPNGKPAEMHYARKAVP